MVVYADWTFVPRSIFPYWSNVTFEISVTFFPVFSIAACDASTASLTSSMSWLVSISNASALP